MAGMHVDEVATDADLVARLIGAQFPEWSGLAVRPVPSAGTVNALYRLGPDLVVRLPRIGTSLASLERERRCLPAIAGKVPCAVPTPIAAGEPGQGFPWPWSVYRWLEGTNPEAGALRDPLGLADDLAAFVAALGRVDTAGGPRAGAPTWGRGSPLATRDAALRDALRQLHGRMDAALLGRAEALWDACLDAGGTHQGEPTWIHGDLSPFNVLCDGLGRLAAVIDFGSAAVGDPAADLIAAWHVLPAAARDRFRASLAADDARWARGRGWALSIALIQLPYYWDTNPRLVANSHHTLAATLEG